jgi:hypothetical protein
VEQGQLLVHSCEAATPARAAPAWRGRLPELLLRGGDTRQSCSCVAGTPARAAPAVQGRKEVTFSTILGVISNNLNALSDLISGLNYSLKL